MLIAIFKKITGFDPAAILIGIFLLVIAAILIPNYERVAGFFGYETRAVLKDRLETANNNVDVAVDANRVSEGTIAVLEDTVKTVEEVIDSKAKADKVTLKFVDELKLKKDKKVEKIIISPDKPQVDKDKEISEVQISSLWDTFCEFNQDNQCSAKPVQAS